MARLSVKAVQISGRLSTVVPQLHYTKATARMNAGVDV